MHNLAGIYLIQSKANQKRYIGSSSRISRRFNQHLNRLKNNDYCNTQLQNIYNKYGENDLIFTVIEKIEDVSKLLEREQWYLDNWKPEINARLTAHNSMDCKIKSAKYISFIKSKNKYQVSYSINSRVYNFGWYDCLEKADEILAHILTLSNEEKLKYHDDNCNGKRKYKNYNYDKKSDRYAVHKGLENKLYYFGQFKTEQEAIDQVTFINSLTEDALKNYHLQNYDKTQNTKYYQLDKKLNKYIVKRRLYNKVYIFGYFSLEEEAIQQVKFIYSLNDSDAYDYYLNNYNRTLNRKSYIYDKRLNAYCVKRCIDGKQYYLGSFKDEETAKKVADYVNVLSKEGVLLFHKNKKELIEQLILSYNK